MKHKRPAKRPPWTVKDVAEALDLSEVTVQALARKMGVGEKHGERTWMFFPADLLRLHRRPKVGKYDRRET